MKHYSTLIRELVTKEVDTDNHAERDEELKSFNDNIKQNKIDVHHHIVPDFYLGKLKNLGITQSYGQDFPAWSPEVSLRNMKKLGIKTSVMSISTPGVHFQNEKFTADLARSCNEYMADVKNNYPGKFGGFSTLPLPYLNNTLDEVKYSLDELKLDGVCLFTHYEGKYLGAPLYDELYAELNRRKAVIFIHPTDPAGQYDPELELANSLIEAPFETTRAVTNMIHNGIISRYPHIRYILAHGGGTIPYLAWRIALSNYTNKKTRPSLFHMINDFIIKGSPKSGLDILRSFYYDTALTASPFALKALHELTGMYQIVFGSDLPFSEKVAPMVAKDLKNFEGFNQDELDNIYYKNCLKLLLSQQEV